MAKSYGWAGRILWVDLTNCKITTVPTSYYNPEKFIGGIGFNRKIFWDLGCPKVAAFDPNNPLLISVGPLTGISGPFNRAEVCGISPSTYPKELFSYSGIGGNCPAELKYAGYDGMVILGRADKPVYLSIHDEDVQIKDAGDLWGIDTFETQKALMAGDPGASVLTIGPAGENLSPTAVILSGTGNAAGQGGFGAVMGSKNLKAISIKGTGGVNIANPDAFLELIKGRKARGQWSEGGAQSWARMPLYREPVKTEMVEKYRKGFSGAFRCPYQCMGYYSIPGIGEGAAMCANWWYDAGGSPHLSPSAKAVWEAQLVAQKLGINHFELIGITEFLRHALTLGILTKEDIGLPIPEVLGGTATDHEFLMELLRGIAYGKNPFFKGVARSLDDFSEIVRRRESGNTSMLKQIYEAAFPIWGQPGHYYEYLGLALHVVTDTRDTGDSSDGYLSFGPGGDPAIAEHFGVPGGWSTYLSGKEIYEGIEHLTFWVSCNHNLKNSLTVCNFVSLPDHYFDPPEMDIRIFQSKAYATVTGIETDVEELWKAGERIANLARAIMVKREDRTREEETYPTPFFETQWTTGDRMDVGPAQLDRAKFEALKDRYYKLCGWDAKTGRPTRTKFEELDLKDVADELERAGKLP